MRIAIFNRYGIMVGGVEQYLAASLSRLSEMGHEVRLYCEHTEELPGKGREAIYGASEHLPPQPTPEDLSGLAARLRDWRPDVICVHSQLETRTEEAVLNSGPAIFFAHAYAGTCISGGKTLHDPAPRPCSRALGPLCFAHYYPHRCGGLDPLSMIRDYSRNRSQLAALHRYGAVVVFSSHMKAEYLRNGVDPLRLKLIPPFSSRAAGSPGVPVGLSLSVSDNATGPLHLGFLGRIEADKGVAILIRSLPDVARRLGRNIEATIAGDGQRRDELQALANSVSARSPGVGVTFTGWLRSEDVQAFFASIHLLVVPSAWPEPFGLVGLEAAHSGVPAAAFAVGGIPDWLTDGRNGHLASGERPTPEGLAGAIIACLRDPIHHGRLRQGALEVSEEFSAERHMALLSETLEDAATSYSV